MDGMKRITAMNARVRRAPVTGLSHDSRKKRKGQGVIYLEKQWVGKNVVIIPITEFRAGMKKIRGNFLTLANQLLKASTIVARGGERW